MIPNAADHLNEVFNMLDKDNRTRFLYQVYEWLKENNEFANMEYVYDKTEFSKHSLHLTEQKYPQQTARFREILNQLYQTHLKKNADYSAMNILGTGAVGITVRFWDKCARLMNLMGFDIQTGTYSGPKRNLVEDESVIDTAIDAAVYGIIFRIYNEGKWGK